MITKEILKQIAPAANNKIISDIETYFDKHMEDYGVNTYLRICHFIAQCAHESDSFKTLEEYASGQAYEGRRDLGNVRPGDGKRYKGRGMIQLTGRANYRSAGDRLNLDLEGNPSLAKDPEVSVLTALDYWKTRNLNRWADRDDIMKITKLINGGFNGIDDRRKYLARAKSVLKRYENAQNEPEERPEPAPVNTSNPLNIVVAKRGDDSDYVQDLQEMLNRKGANLTVDGKFGGKTEEAVKKLQRDNDLPETGIIDTNTLNVLMK